MTNKKQIKQVLNYGDKEKVLKYLDLVNLKDKEKEAVLLVDIQGLNHEQASMKMDCSVSTVSNLRRKAFAKISECLQNLPFF